MAEHREKHGFDYWPKRNDPLRATVVPQISKSNKDEMNNNTLSRCRSLEFLEDRKRADNNKLEQNGRGNLHRSFELLNNTEQHEAIIHTATSKSSSMQHSTNTSESKSSSKQYSLDFRENYGKSILSDAESLEDFSNKTKGIIQMKRASRQKFKERTINELRERQMADNLFLKFPPNFSSTLTSNSIDDLRDYHSSSHYPNDFDDISVEMKNITKLLSASLIEPLESTPSTSSSFYKSTDKLTKRFTLYDKDNDDEDDNSSIKSDFDVQASKLYGSKSSHVPNPMSSNGFFQNTCFENRSSSSCDTLKSVEPKTNGKCITNGKVVDHHNNDDEEESDTDLEEVVDITVKTPAHLQTANQNAPRPGIVSLAKNLQVTNKMPTVRSTLAGTANCKSLKLLREPLKPSDPHKSQNNSNKLQNIASSTTTSTNQSSFKQIYAENSHDSSENEVQITVHKARVQATVHANLIQTDPDE